MKISAYILLATASCVSEFSVPYVLNFRILGVPVNVTNVSRTAISFHLDAKSYVHLWLRNMKHLGIMVDVDYLLPRDPILKRYSSLVRNSGVGKCYFFHWVWSTYTSDAFFPCTWRIPIYMSSY